MHNFNMCYKKMEGNKECESVTKIEVFRWFNKVRFEKSSDWEIL
jgi:hypothetical protein